MPGKMPRTPTFLKLVICWWIVFPLGCLIGVCSFVIQQTMSGRVLAILCNPVTLTLSLVLFAITGKATYGYLKERVGQSQSTKSEPSVPAGYAGPLWDSELDR